MKHRVAAAAALAAALMTATPPRAAASSYAEVGKCPPGLTRYVNEFPPPPVDNATCPESWTRACVQWATDNSIGVRSGRLTDAHRTALNRCPTEWKIVNTNYTIGLQYGVKATMRVFFAHSSSDSVKFTGDVSKWDTSEVVHMQFVFHENDVFNSDISGWQTSNVESMEYMFNGAKAFNGNIAGWDTGKVMDMSFMFRNAREFDQDISGWNTSSVYDMRLMFHTTLVEAHKPAFRMNFAQDISCWDVSKVAEFSNVFGTWTASGLINPTFIQENGMMPFTCNAYHMLRIFNRTGTPGLAMSQNPDFATFNASACPYFASTCHNYVHGTGYSAPAPAAASASASAPAPPAPAASSSDTDWAAIGGGIAAAVAVVVAAVVGVMRYGRGNGNGNGNGANAISGSTQSLL